MANLKELTESHHWPELEAWLEERIRVSMVELAVGPVEVIAIAKLQGRIDAYQRLLAEKARSE